MLRQSNLIYVQMNEGVLQIDIFGTNISHQFSPGCVTHLYRIMSGIIFSAPVNRLGA